MQLPMNIGPQPTRSMILGPNGEPIVRNLKRSGEKAVLSAAYDDAFQIPELADHFAGSNALSARAALSSRVRKGIREKIRHERNQNSYLAGMLQTSANYLIGTGPKLQMMMAGVNGKADRAINRAVEQDWVKWCRRIRLADKLRTMVIAKKGDGEGFGVMSYNPLVGKDTGIPLDVIVAECDQIEDLRFGSGIDIYGSGGIVYDEYDNPTSYPVLRTHPGDNAWIIRDSMEPQFVPREFMIHMFRRDRPGQRRGVSEWLPAMPLFALYRRMTLATIGNIETAASLSAVLETDADTDDEANPTCPIGEEDWFLSFPIARRMMMTLPSGAKMNQFESATPNSQYDTFTRSLIREIARCTSMPYNIAAGDSSSYNYASGRLDHQSFFLSNRVELDEIENECVERIFDRWIRIRASHESGIAPEDIDTDLYKHQWVWDGLEHVDPLKEANASRVRLAAGITTRGREYFKAGIDIDDVDEKAAEELGFDSVKEYRQAIAFDLYGVSKAQPSVPETQPKAPVSRRDRVKEDVTESMKASIEQMVEELVGEMLAQQA